MGDGTWEGCVFTLTLRDGTPFRALESQAKCKGGKSIPIGISTSAINDAHGECIGAVGIFRALTEIKQLQRQLFQSEKMAGIGMLAGGVAHEFNNLIGGMMGYAQLAKSTRDISDIEKCIEVVLNSSQRAKEITKNLLSFSRRTEPKQEEAYLSEIIEMALSLIQRDLEKENIRIVRGYESSLRITTDIGQVQQVILNMAINAKHAMQNGGQLTVSYRKMKEYAEIEIKDTGVGIKKEDLTKIFEPFFTTKGSLGGSQTPGTGLGLSVSYGIIRSLEGEISVESEIGKGTSFTVKLPLKGVERLMEPGIIGHHGEKAPQEASMRSVSLTGTVMVVDDEEYIRDVVKKCLSELGITVLTAENGEEGIQRIKNVPCDLLIIDALMPGLNGIETLRKIREMNADIPAVIMTGIIGDGLDQLREESQGLGVRDFLQKPFDMLEVKNLVKGMLEQFNSGEEKYAAYS